MTIEEPPGLLEVCTATENENLHDGMANTLTGNKGLWVGIRAILGKTIENKINIQSCRQRE